MSSTQDHKDCPAENDSGFKNRARYDFYHIYQVELSNKEQLELFARLEKEDSLIFIGHVRKVGQKVLILVPPHLLPDLTEQLRKNYVQHKILNKNFQEKIDKNFTEVLPVGTDVKKDFDWKHFFQLETIYEWLEHIAKEHNEVAELQDMGTSTQGVQIKGIKIKSRDPRCTIFIEGGIHSYTWVGTAVATYFINKLMTSTDPIIKEMADEYTWVIFPCINPDGYKYTFEYDRMWRKNRKSFEICCGVDLNRNFPAHWNATGSDPCHFDYVGPQAGSELETQRVMTYIKDHVDEDRIKVYLSLHSFSQAIAFPLGYTNEHVKNYEDLNKLGTDACEKIKNEGPGGRSYKGGSFKEIFLSAKSGYSTDWAYDEAKIPIVYTVGLRRSINIEDLFIIPAAEIEPTAEEIFLAIQTIVSGAAKMSYFDK